MAKKKLRKSTKGRSQKSSSSSKVKTGKGLFDLLKCITVNKTPWNELTELDQKNFNIFMTNKFLSMNRDYVDIVNDLQQYTNGVMTPKDVYNFYYEVLPRQQHWSKYIKKQGDKVNIELRDLIKKYYEFSGREAEDYILWYKSTDDGVTILKNIMHQYGLDSKQQTKLLK